MNKIRPMDLDLPCSLLICCTGFPRLTDGAILSIAFCPLLFAS